MKGLTLYHCARSHTFFLYGYWHNPLPTSLLPLRECKDSRGVCVFASLYSCEQEWVRDVYRSRAHRKTEENGRVVFMWGKEREWACVCFCQIMKVFFFWPGICATTPADKEHRLPLHSSDRGRRPRDKQRGSQRWRPRHMERFIISKSCSSISPLPLSLMHVGLRVQAARRWFIGRHHFAVTTLWIIHDSVVHSWFENLD